MSINDPITANYFKKSELAEALDVSTRTLDRWENQRIGPPRFKMGNTTLYPKAGTLEWMQKRTSEPKRIVHPAVKRAQEQESRLQRKELASTQAAG